MQTSKKKGGKKRDEREFQVRGGLYATISRIKYTYCNIQYTSTRRKKNTKGDTVRCQPKNNIFVLPSKTRLVLQTNTRFVDQRSKKILWVRFFFFCFNIVDSAKIMIAEVLRALQSQPCIPLVAQSFGTFLFSFIAQLFINRKGSSFGTASAVFIMGYGWIGCRRIQIRYRTGRSSGCSRLMGSQSCQPPFQSVE